MEHIEEVKGKSRADRTILERNIYALGLLEALVLSGLPFIFKGGTCMTILLESPKRLSTDIDIVVSPGTDVDCYIAKASEIFPFKGVKQQIRRGRDGIEKRHYQFTYDSPAYGGEFYIILDILFENNNYSKLLNAPITNKFLISEEPQTFVTTPSPDCLMGDKLTAFAPHTTGIPLGINKELEIIKQMFDISCLFDECSDFEDVYESYMNTVRAEIAYRGKDMTPEDCLLDTIDAASCIAGRGLAGNDYPSYLSGIKSLSTHMIFEPFNAELAVKRAAKVMYTAACVLKKTPINKNIDPDKYQKVSIASSRYGKLTKIRRLDPEAFWYIVESIKLIEGDDIVTWPH